MVFVFHFNRGRSLANLVASIERHVDAPLIVMDDESDLVEAREVLGDIASRHEVRRPEASRTTEHRTGGLHANMTQAMKLAAERGAEMVLMIQDDMQVVRDLTRNDLDVARAAFARPNASCVLQCCFLKANNRERVDDGAMKLVQPGLYERRLVDSAKQVGKLVSFSDTGIVSMSLFNDQLGYFRTGERANEALLRSMNKRMLFLVNPFMHWCPMPLSFRGRKRQYRDRLADWISGAGVHPITSLQGESLSQLLERDPRRLPYAEDFLTSPTLPPAEYWSTHGGRTNLHSCGGWRRSFGRILRNV